MDDPFFCENALWVGARLVAVVAVSWVLRRGDGYGVVISLRVGGRGANSS